MVKNTNIEFCDHTQNFWYGCGEQVSPGCANCYAKREMERFGMDWNVITRSRTKFYEPLKWKQPARVFTCSWSDFFHPKADQWREDAFDVIRKTPHLTYLILTKRMEHAVKWLRENMNLSLPANVWMGVSVENQLRAAKLIPALLEIDCVVRWVNLEPLLLPVDLSAWIDDLDWVTTGGESGNLVRPSNLEWFIAVKDLCHKHNVPYLHKQNGGSKKIDGHWGGNLLDGVAYNEYPAVNYVEKFQDEEVFAEVF